MVSEIGWNGETRLGVRCRDPKGKRLFSVRMVVPNPSFVAEGTEQLAAELERRIQHGDWEPDGEYDLEFIPPDVARLPALDQPGRSRPDPSRRSSRRAPQTPPIRSGSR